MKNLFKYAIMSAIALTGAAGFSGCSSDDEVVDNPDYNPLTNTVKTAISLSIDPNNAAGTRQWSQIVQVSGFRGIQNLYLFTATSEMGNATPLTAAIQLDAIGDTELSAEQSSKVYTNKEVGVGTTNFLFYGKAYTLINGDSPADTKLRNGFTTSTLSTSNATPAAITFLPSSIVGKTEGSFPENWTGAANSLTEYLNGIAKAEGWAASTNAQLKFAYSSFTKENAPRAGSASAVLATAQELYEVVYPVSVNSSDSETRAVANSVLSAIMANTYVTTTGEGTDLKLSWNTTKFDSSFPTSLGLPEGAAQYRWVAGTTPGFEYITEPVLNTSDVSNLEDIVYPNELYYLTSTGLKATAGTAIWPNKVKDWRDATWSGWTDRVEASSKNIALVNNIQYGSALLATAVKCTPKSITQDEQTVNVLYDNALDLVEGATENNPITYKDGAFPLTGVIVGGQPSKVGWNFLPTSDATFDKMVFDRYMSESIAADNTNQYYSHYNYTMVFDNLKPSGEQGSVNVALEFQNNSGFDFYGKDGLILKGQKFYLVATLKLDDATGSLDFTEEDTYFPSTTPRIFVQDFMTELKVNLTSGDKDTKNSGALADAVVTLPDLRISNQSLGLSIDLAWKTGYTFEVPIQ